MTYSPFNGTFDGTHNAPRGRLEPAPWHSLMAVADQVDKVGVLQAGKQLQLAVEVHIQIALGTGDFVFQLLDGN